MRTVDISYAKRHLSRLIDDASRGESFIIARAGKPLVQVSSLQSPPAVRRTGFLKGRISVPNDFDDLGTQTIEDLFGDGRRS